MSVSTTTDHFFTFGVHRVPAGASAKDFEVNVGALMDGLAALPAAKKNLLSLNLLLPNDVTTAHAQTLGLPIPQTSVFIITECETMNHQAEFFKDAEVQRLIVAADHWGFRTNSCVFSADIVTRIEASALNDGRILWVGYFRVPADMPAFEEKMEAFIEKCVASSAFQKNIVKHTTWIQSSDSAPHLREVGFPAAEPSLVVMIECQSYDHIIDLALEPETKHLFDEAINDFAFHVDSICFSADVVKKIGQEVA